VKQTLVSLQSLAFSTACRGAPETHFGACEENRRLTHLRPFVSLKSFLFPFICACRSEENRIEIIMAIKFRGVDFIDFDTLLNDDERLVRDTARKFIEDNLIPIIEECNRAGRFPRELVKPMAEMGFFGASLKGYGCAGMSNVEYGLVTQELERGDSGVRSFVSVQSALVMYPIYAFGSDEQKKTWLPALQQGEKLGCFGLTEPDFGSNPGGMRTRARKVGNEYVLNGEKMWITSGSIADVAIIWAKVENEDNKIRGFLVETDRPGFKAEDIHGKWSLRASVTSGLSLQDVHIPEANLLSGSGGLKSPLMCLNQARYGISWGAIGAAMACYDCALQYSQLRKQFRDQPIASHQMVQEKLAWMITEITKAQLLVLQVGRLKDADKVQHQHISMAKRNNVWMALECARLSRDILGANGVADDYPIMRHMMNLESVKTYEGTQDIHTLIIGASITGIDAF
jgi:glutaryl-CoA dehydrogenase